jgi:predicted SprT family Zn-dependent metalloprotease
MNTLKKRIFEKNAVDIPKTFELGGLTINVVFDETLFEKTQHVGKAKYADQTITMDPTVTDREMLEQLFLHELVHWILFMMQKDDMQEDEEFINLFSHFLYQALITARPGDEELEI